MSTTPPPTGAAPGPAGPTGPTGPESEFGPRGYLPERAAKRARKIVLREQMGTGWPLAALVAALLVAVAGGWYLLTATGSPQAPFVAVAELAEVAPGTAVTLPADGTDVVVSRAAGGVQAFAAPEGVLVVLCDGSLESERAVWSPDGRLIGGGGDGDGGASLAPLPLRVYDGVVFVDPTAPAPAPEPAPAPRDATPTC